VWPHGLVLLSSRLLPVVVVLVQLLLDPALMINHFVFVDDFVSVVNSTQTLVCRCQLNCYHNKETRKAMVHSRIVEDDTQLAVSCYTNSQIIA
jgi:hypothetical protein